MDKPVELPEAQFYERLEEGRIRCHLCPQGCRISPGKVGYCFIRGNRDGTLYPLLYGRISSAALDPIEKKPLYHFHPGSTIYSIGGIGCNLRCLWCQNWNIAQPRDAFPNIAADEVIDNFTQRLSPEQGVEHALSFRNSGCIGIAYTYNEPFIWFEYVEDMAKMARAAGLKNVLVTNGYVEEEPLRKLLPLIDAMNIDVKGLSEDFYVRVGGHLAPVLRTAEISKAAGCHIEITNLLIPTLNDSEGMIGGLIDWVADRLGEDTPLHFSRYFPVYKLEIMPTPLEILRRAESIAKRRLRYVHLGNV